MSAPHPEFAIPVAQLEGMGDEHLFTVRPAWVRGVLEDQQDTSPRRAARPAEAEPSNKDGELRVRLTRSGTDIVVQARLKLDLSLPCARCLERFTMPIDKPISVLMVPRSKLKNQGGTEEYEVTEAEADMVPYDGEIVVLDDLVHDELVLEIPMIPLCSEACPGIRPPPGSVSSEEAPAVDPRLAPLAALKAKLKKS